VKPRLAILTAAALGFSGLGIAPTADAAKVAGKIPCGPPVVVKAKRKRAARVGAMMLNDLPCRTAWRKGKHVYWVPRHGPDYKRGQDWRIVVRVKLFPGAEGHPVAKLRGHGSYGANGGRSSPSAPPSTRS